MSSENYGALVKSLRQKMGLTQNQVAESLGVTPGYISNVENNRTAMSLRILTYYAKLCGIRTQTADPHGDSGRRSFYNAYRSDFTHHHCSV